MPARPVTVTLQHSTNNSTYTHHCFVLSAKISFHSLIVLATPSSLQVLVPGQLLQTHHAPLQVPELNFNPIINNFGNSGTPVPDSTKLDVPAIMAQSSLKCVLSSLEHVLPLIYPTYHQLPKPTVPLFLTCTGMQLLVLLYANGRNVLTMVSILKVALVPNLTHIPD